MKNPLVLLLCLSFITTSAQTISGKIVDSASGEPLPYVRIGIEGKNAGTISHENGEFTLELNADRDSITFSMLGYERLKMRPAEIRQAKTIKLTPTTYALKEVTVSADEIIELTKLGRPEATKTTIGHRGINHWGTGSEWGVHIPIKDARYLLQSVAFHTRFNTLDSVLYRIHIYEYDGSRPTKNILKKEVYVKSYRRNKWIVKELSDEAVVLTNDFVVTMEVVRLWYQPATATDLFFTYGKNPDNLKTFSRESSHAPWEVDKMPPLAMFVSARKLTE